MNYCERGENLAFWAEPLNAVSNASFLIAGLVVLYQSWKRQGLSRELIVLISLSFAIGVGSSLWHTIRTPWSMWLDILPILLFQVSFIWIYARQQLGWSAMLAGGTLLGLLVLSLAAMPIKDTLNGSLTYFPAWLLLAGFGLAHISRGKNRPWQLLSAAILLSFALFFRTIDLSVCGQFPHGTHFLWHLINGGVLYLAMQSLLSNPPAVETR